MGTKIKKMRVPKQKRALETRNHIIKIAKHLISRKGFHGTNSREIAAEAGISIGSFYTYFPDKKVLLLEILKLHIENFMMNAFFQEKIGIFDGLGKKEIFCNLIKRVINAYNHSPEFHRETLALRYSDPDVKKLFDKAKALELKYIISLLKIFEEDLRIKNMEAAAFVIHSAVEKVAHSIQLLGTEIDKDSILDELSDMINTYLFKL